MSFKSTSLSASLVLLAVSGAASAHDAVLQGHATGVYGTIHAGSLTKTLLINDNGMSCNAQPNEETVSGISNPKPIYLNIKTISTYTLGAHSTVDSTASTSAIHVDLPGVKIDSSGVSSRAHAECDPDTLVTKVSGGADILDMKINDQPVQITAAPNQTIVVGDVAQIVFNEQIVWKTEFKVNAIHIKLFNASYPANGDLYVAYSRAKITCTATS
jgi:hypothetical protein